MPTGVLVRPDVVISNVNKCKKLILHKLSNKRYVKINFKSKITKFLNLYKETLNKINKIK